MYQTMWPGAYNFKSEIKLYLKWIKEQIDFILYKIDEAEKLIA